MNRFWENLDPKHKQWAVIGLAVVALILVVAIFVGEAEQKYSRGADQEVVRNVLNERTSRDIGIDAMAARLKALEEQLRERTQELNTTQEKLEETRNSVGVGKDVARQLASLKEDVAKIREEKSKTESELAQLKQNIVDGNLDMPSLQANQDATGAAWQEGEIVVPPSRSSAVPDEKDVNRYFQNAPVPQFGDARRQTTSGGNVSAGENAESPSRKVQITTVTEAKQNPAEEQQTADSEGEGTGIYIPSGSLLTGTLMTGLDAPTGQGARRDPFPVVVRLQKDAILPNDFSADVKGCMAILSGYGDLSSERVYLRSEGVSCIREDGRSIEARLSGYAVGEDGKAGLRSRLVTKQGSLVGRSMIAGFFGGVSQAFNVSPVPTLDTSGDSENIRYLNTFSTEALQGGLVSGASNALEKVADFWLKLADSMYPILQMDAGRQMDIVMVKGAELKLQ